MVTDPFAVSTYALLQGGGSAGARAALADFWQRACQAAALYSPLKLTLWE